MSKIAENNVAKGKGGAWVGMATKPKKSGDASSKAGVANGYKKSLSLTKRTAGDAKNSVR